MNADSLAAFIRTLETYHRTMLVAQAGPVLERLLVGIERSLPLDPSSSAVRDRIVRLLGADVITRDEITVLLEALSLLCGQAPAPSGSPSPHGNLDQCHCTNTGAAEDGC